MYSVVSFSSCVHLSDHPYHCGNWSIHHLQKLFHGSLLAFSLFLIMSCRFLSFCILGNFCREYQIFLPFTLLSIGYFCISTSSFEASLGDTVVKNLPAQCRRRGLDSWVRKIAWRRKWQPTPVLLPRKSHGWRSLVVYSRWERVRHDWATSLDLDYIAQWTLLSALQWTKWEGNPKKRGDTCTADSLCYTVKTYTTL